LPTTDTHATVEAIWRIESPRIVGGLMRLVRDLSEAETWRTTRLSPRSSSGRGDGVPPTPAPG
jgi:predicted RNA polymerase sigma factor